MLKLRGLAIPLLLLACVVSASAAVAAESEMPSAKPVPAEALKKGLSAALGDSFEFIGGEVGWTSYGSTYWFAKVRARAAGDYAIAYSTRSDLPDEVRKLQDRPDRTDFIIPFTIGDRGAPRLIKTDGWAQPVLPQANVGDTIVLPISFEHQVGHAFKRIEGNDPKVKRYFHVSAQTQLDEYTKRADAKPAVHFEAATDDGPLELLASCNSATVDRPGTGVGHDVSGFVQFKKPAESNVVGRLPKPVPDAGPDDGLSFRVLAREKPITAFIVTVNETSWIGDRSSSSDVAFRRATLQVRVGDRLLIECGNYNVPIKQEKKTRPQLGVIELRKFKSVEAYVVEEPLERRR